MQQRADNCFNAEMNTWLSQGTLSLTASRSRLPASALCALEQTWGATDGGRAPHTVVWTHGLLPGS